MFKSNTLRMVSTAIVGAAIALAFDRTMMSPPPAGAAEPVQATYKGVSLKGPISDQVIEQKLNEISAQGWEFHSTIGNTLVFKKRSP